MIEHDWQTILGVVPSKSNMYRIGNKMLFKTDKLREYEDRFYMQCGRYRNMDIKGLFEFYCRVYYPSQRSDLDNSLKVQLDCLQHTKTIANDNKCVKIVAEKFIDPERPRVEFRIIEV